MSNRGENRIVGRREVVDPNETIEQIVILLRDRANRHSVFIPSKLARELPGVPADRVLLRQTLMNLLLNRIDAMKDTSGELTVVSRKTEEDQLLISVHDLDVGLPVEGPERIFGALFTTKPEGTDMRLPVGQRIVESFGGCLWAAQAEGCGPHFLLLSQSNQGARHES